MAIRIMVPVDGSELSESALPYAVELARQIDGRIHIVRVHEVIGMEAFAGVDYVACVQNDPELREIERKYLARIQSDPAIMPFVEKSVLLGGLTVAALCDYARHEKIDMVIMATHGRGGISRAIVGSVADDVMRRIKVPVVLLRPEDEKFAMPIQHQLRHVLVPVDGTESQFMVDVAISLLGHHVRYTLFEIISPASGVSAQSALAVKQTLEGFTRSLQRRGVDAQQVVLARPNVAKAICEFAAAEQVDLIAMATAGRGGWRRWLEGSVGASLMHDSPVPIMLLTTAAMRSAMTQPG